MKKEKEKFNVAFVVVWSTILFIALLMGYFIYQVLNNL